MFKIYNKTNNSLSFLLECTRVVVREPWLLDILFYLLMLCCCCGAAVVLLCCCCAAVVPAVQRIILQRYALRLLDKICCKVTKFDLI